MSLRFTETIEEFILQKTKENKKLLQMIHEYQRIQGNVLINEFQDIKNQIASLEKKIEKLSQQHFEEI